MPQSSISGMQAMTPAGMPATSVCEGRVSKGKGTSEPMITKGRTSGCWRRRCSARNTMGGIPTPPPMSSASGCVSGTENGTPMGPMTLSRSPGVRSASSAVPGPTVL